MILYVGLFGHSAVVFHVFMFFHIFLCFTDSLCGCVFFSDILLIYSAVWLPVCLIYLLTYLLNTEISFKLFTAAVAMLIYNDDDDVVKASSSRQVRVFRIRREEYLQRSTCCRMKKSTSCSGPSALAVDDILLLQIYGSF